MLHPLSYIFYCLLSMYLNTNMPYQQAKISCHEVHKNFLLQNSTKRGKKKIKKKEILFLAAVPGSHAVLLLSLVLLPFANTNFTSSAAPKPKRLVTNLLHRESLLYNPNLAIEAQILNAL